MNGLPIGYCHSDMNMEEAKNIGYYRLFCRVPDWLIEQVNASAQYSYNTKIVRNSTCWVDVRFKEISLTNRYHQIPYVTTYATLFPFLRRFVNTSSYQCESV